MKIFRLLRFLQLENKTDREDKIVDVMLKPSLIKQNQSSGSADKIELH